MNNSSKIIYDCREPPDPIEIGTSIPEIKRKLQSLVKGSQNVLLKIYSIFPLDLVPNILTVDENKVSIIYKQLFGAETVHSVLIENITDVTVNLAPLFARLRIVDSTNYRHPQTIIINKLRRKDALRARRLIQGLIAAKSQNINLCDLNTRTLCQELERLGAARQPESSKDKLQE